MENHPDHEFQRVNLLRAVRHAQIEASQLWLHYFGLGGDAGEYEVEAYLHGSFTLPPRQRDLLAHAANELIDGLPPPPRAPYSTDSAGDAGPGPDTEPAEADVVRSAGPSLDWLFDAAPDDSDPGSRDPDAGTIPP
ncbi:MAG: hypothetical protein JWM61_3218 [Micrococcaceae bacterium]|nr:hypothetical protein [Micrococcaceae bacterium]